MIVYLEPEYDSHHLRVIAKLLKEIADQQLKLVYFHQAKSIEVAKHWIQQRFPNDPVPSFYDSDSD